MTVATTRFGNGVAFIWVANALLLAALGTQSAGGWTRSILACALASVAATAAFGLGWQAALPLAMINMAEAAVGACLLRRFSPEAMRFESLQAMLAFVAAAGIAGPFVTAFGPRRWARSSVW